MWILFSAWYLFLLTKKTEEKRKKLSKTKENVQPHTHSQNDILYIVFIAHVRI